MEFGTGCIIDKEFEKTNFDYNTIKSLVSMANIIPDDYIIPNYKILNQGQVGSCVAHALVQNRLLKENEQLQEDKTYSTNWIYHNRKVTDWQGEGMYTEQALSNMITDGVVYYEDMTGNTKYSEKPSNFEESKLNLLPKAQRHKITAYYQIKTDDVLQKIEDIKTAILTTGAVILTVDVFSSFYEDGANGGIIRNFKVGEQYYGSHAMAIIGWNRKNEWIVANSWGNTWGDNGLCYISMLSNILRQYFVIVDNYIEKELGDLKYVIALEGTKDISEEEFIAIKNMLNVNDIIRKNINGIYYIIEDRYFNSFEEAKTYRLTSRYGKNNYIFSYAVVKNVYVCFSFGINSKDYAQYIINNFQKSLPIHDEFEFSIHEENDKFYIVIKKLETVNKAQEFINKVVQQDAAYTGVLITKQV